MTRMVLAASFLFSVSTLALAEEAKTEENTKTKNYLILYSGTSSWKNTSNDNEIESGTAGYGIGMTYGRNLDEYLAGLSFELDLSYRNNEVHGLNFGGNNFSADGNYLGVYNFGTNLRYTYNLTQNFDIYVFAGPGISYVDLIESDPVRKIQLETNIVPTVQVGTGIGYNFNEKWGLTLGYRYMRSLTDLEIKYNGKSLEDSYDSHMIYGGIVYRF